jgi:hypothetical protein
VNSLLLAAAAAAAAGLGWLEWRRPDRAFRARRVAAVIAASATLTFLAAGHGATRATGNTAIVATAGAVPARVRRLADSAGAPVYVLSEAGDARTFGGGARPMPDIAALVRAEPSVRRLVITGWGLDSTGLAAAGDRSIIFVPAPIPPGIATVRWPGVVPLGSRLVVRGTTIGLRPGTPIQLTGPDGAADSGRIAQDSTFVLGTRPPAVARLRYALRLLPTGGPVITETLGAAIVDRPPPRVLILDRSPSFESRYLEDWLRDAGGSLAVRTEISRGRYRTRYLNRAAELGRLTASALRSFDVAVLGTRTLAALEPSERATLESAVRDSGLGVVLGAEDAAPHGTGLLEGFSLRASGGVDRTSRLVWDGDSAGRRAVGIAPLVLGGDDAIRSLASDSAGNAVAAWRRSGAGAVAVSLVTTPSRWRLGGEPKQFAAFWSLLLGAAGRPAAAGWEMTGPALVDRPLRLARLGPDTTPAAVVDGPDGGRDSMFLAQDVIVPTRWEGSYWPRTPGWHRVSGDSLALDFDVRAGGWATLEAAALHRVTAERAAAVIPSRTRAAPPSPRRIPSIVLFGVFLGSAAVLWSSGRRPRDGPRTLP